MLKILLFLIFTCFAFAEPNLQMDLAGENRVDNYPTMMRIDLEGQASDGKTYVTTVSCIPEERNSDNEDQGIISVMKSSSHTGASTIFDYKDCLGLVAGLKNFELLLRLQWDRTSFEDHRTGSLEFKIFHIDDVVHN